MTSTAVALPRPARQRRLVIAERLPRPDESSGSCRFLAIVTALAAEADVDLWVELDESQGSTPLSAARVADDRRRLQASGIRVLPLGWGALRRALGTRYDTVICEFYHVAARYLPVLRDQQPSAALIVDSVDLHYARLAAGAAIGAVHPNWARDVYEEETATYRAADAVVLVSAGDARLLGCEKDMPPAICVPNAVTIRPRPELRRLAEAVFVGHFHHAPNLDGIRWFVHEVWPLVRQRRGDAKLTIIGSYASDEVHALDRAPGVDVVGYVPDITPYLDRAAVAIAPLRFGAGMKGKVTDALANGLPVVTTSVGAQGLDIVHGQHAWIADDAPGFAEAVIGIFDDPAAARAIGTAGQQYIDRICGPDAIAAAIGHVSRARRLERRAVAGTSGLRRLRLIRLAFGHWRLTAGRRMAGWMAPPRPGLAGQAGPPA